MLYWARAPFVRKSKSLKKCVHYIDRRCTLQTIFDRASCTNVWLVFNWHVWYVVHVIGDMPIAQRDTASDTKQWWFWKSTQKHNHKYGIAKACNPRTHNSQFSDRNMSARSAPCKQNWTLLYSSSCTYIESSHQLEPGTSSTQASGWLVWNTWLYGYTCDMYYPIRLVIGTCGTWCADGTKGYARRHKGQAVMVSRTNMWGYEYKAETPMWLYQQMQSK